MLLTCQPVETHSTGIAGNWSQQSHGAEFQQMLNWPGTKKKIHLSTSTLNILAAFLLTQELTIHTADGL